MLSTNETFEVKDQIQVLFKVIEMEVKYINISLIRQAFSWRTFFGACEKMFFHRHKNP